MPLGLKTLLRSVGGLLLPETCTGCGSNLPTSDGFCQQCSAELLALTLAEYCPRCGENLSPGRTAALDGCSFCPEVMPRFSQVVRLGPYSWPLRPAIQRLKYHGGPASLSHLARLLAGAVQAHLPQKPDLVLAVPMHWRRRISRGRNHALSLAAALARELALPLGDELIRVRPTPPQVHLPASQRKINIRGAFQAVRTDTLSGCRVLLVDDVVTTGATADEASRVLLQAGAAEVFLAVLAKTASPAAYSKQLAQGQLQE